MKSFYKIVLVLCFPISLVAQDNKVSIVASLDDDQQILSIQQDIIFYNTSKDTLREIFLHNWPNAYKNNKTPLSNRLIKDYNKSLYFAKPEDRGETTILNFSVDYESVAVHTVSNQIDILRAPLKKGLLPQDSVRLSATYKVKIPKDTYTKQGKTATGYHLEFWYLSPAIYSEAGWQIMSNLNLDDLYTGPTSYEITLKLPKKYILQSNLYQYKTKGKDRVEYLLVGQQKTNIELTIDSVNNFKSFKTKNIEVRTDIPTPIESTLATEILNRELLFIEKYLGSYPHKEILLSKLTQQKNPIYGLNQLPNFVRPFSDVFKWDLTLFKALSKDYIENTMLLNNRTDYWLLDGLQIYLMLAYVDEYYPEVKLLGNLSKVWGIRSFNFSKLEFNDKYPFVYQFSARKFLDQALTTKLDSLSNFNRKIVSKYKAGMGLRYLEQYLGDDVLKKAIQEFYITKSLKPTSSSDFATILARKTTKDIRWFFGDFIRTNKKIDYTIKEAYIEKDSVYVTIKNKRNITAPLTLYGIKNKEVLYKKWIQGIDSTATVVIPKGDFDRVSLNFENDYPEYNTIDNSKSLKKRIFNKPLKLKFVKDVNDSYYSQLFYQPDIQYNFYDGVLLGLKLHNKPILSRNLQFGLTPSYGTTSKKLTGVFYTTYNQYFENSKIYRISYGINGSNKHYAPNLSYNTFNQNIIVQFNRKSLRDAGNNFIAARLINIDKEVAPGIEKTDQDKYSVFNLKYFYNKADIIKEFQYQINTEVGSKFSKVSTDIRFRSLTSKNTQLDFRFFAGAFLNNRTSGDYFSFGLDRANDYLFELNYIGRSESSGVLSQQFILAEGGFKSVLPTRFANQFMMSFNTSIGMWRWLEIYNDVAFLKNKSAPMYFAYENGVRFNFVNSIFEIYLPLYSNNGWEISNPAYSKNIRFVITANPKAIFNFFRRGFL